MADDKGIPAPLSFMAGVFPDHNYGHVTQQQEVTDTDVQRTRSPDHDLIAACQNIGITVPVPVGAQVKICRCAGREPRIVAGLLQRVANDQLLSCRFQAVRLFDNTEVVPLLTGLILALD